MSDTAIGFLQRAVDWFADHGVRIERVMTDNGVAYRSHAFADECRALAIKHKRTRPYTPRTSGKAERFIQTLLREWAYRFAYPSSQARRDLLDRYLHVYNYHRAHTALGDQPAISRLDGNNAVTRDT